MPRQIYCNVCTERTFYVMAQDDGSIEVFCAKNNHKQTLVDIPALVEVIYSGRLQESKASESRGPTEIAREEACKVQEKVEVKPPLVFDGPHGVLDS